jgi:hypothetical protein
MLGIFEFFILIIDLFILVVYAIYSDIKSDLKDYIKDENPACKRKCTKPKKADGNCYHPIKYNAYLKKNQEVKSQLICPWSCSSGFSDDPRVCQYDQDCSGCTPVSFNSIDSACPNSTYGCCADRKTEKTDEFGNNCLGTTGPAKESFTTYEQMVDDEPIQEQLKILQEQPPPQIYPACPNISCPNESPFQKDIPSKEDVSLGTLPHYPWSVVTEYI